MALKIRAIKPESTAEKLNIQPDDILIAINGSEINDTLDYFFYQADEEIEIVISRKGEHLYCSIKKGYSDDLGLGFYEPPYRRCGCNCIFCFIDQMHPEARPSLKIKDDDFRLSFLHGNFITLTNLSHKDFQRIIRQRLSPLYISVHTTDDKLRQQIMRYRKGFNILKALQFLAKHRIRIHTQIVLIPGWNDGEELKKTVYDLARFFPAVQSIAIVPVGLTKFRDGLPELTPVKSDIAEVVITDSEKWRESFKKRYGAGIVMLADEFFLLAKEEIPSAEYYEGFPQIENGVGMTRQLLDAWQERKQNFSTPPDFYSLTIVTAELISPIIRRIVREFQELYSLTARTLVVENEYLGKTVTVTGLLSAQDVIKAISFQKGSDIALLPSNMFNQEGLTIDDKTLQDIISSTGVQCKIVKDF
jgi:putative radical SAM enzyme (TIGR03279 family)